MARVVIDSTDAESSGIQTYEGPTPPAGLYRVRVGYAKYGKAKSGNMMLTVVLEFDTDNEKKKQYNGYGLWHNMVQVPQSLFRTKEFLTAIGQPTKLALDYDEDTGKVNRIGTARVNKVWLLVKASNEPDPNGGTRLKVDSLTALPKQPDVEDEADGEMVDGEEVVDGELVDDNYQGDLSDDAVPASNGGYADEPPF